MGRSNYDVFVAPLDPAWLELQGRPLRLSAHPASDRYPDVGARPSAPPPAVGAVEAPAVLKACSRVPSLREISPYRSALVVCEWELTRRRAGQPADARLRAVRWGLRDGQPIVSAAPGFAARLRLEPMAGTPQTEGYPVFDSLPGPRCRCTTGASLELGLPCRGHRC